MAKRPIKVYADTSVYGGVFDEEFTEASQALFSILYVTEIHPVRLRSSTYTRNFRLLPKR